MSQSGVIIRRNGGKFIPEAYIKLAIANNPNGWGAAFVENGEFKINSDIEGMTLEDMRDTQATFESSDMTFYLCQADSGLSLADVSPHVLVVEQDGKDEIPKLLCFIEGNFPGSEQAGSSHPPEYHLVNDILVPKFESLCELVDNDLDKLVEQLKKPHFKKELLLHSVSRGHITILAANGASLTFSQPDGTSQEYPWGWVSNNYGFETAEKPKEIVEKKKSLFTRGTRSTVREAAPSPAIAAAVEKPKTEASVIKNYTVKKEKPPSNLSRRERKDWYTARLGYKPQGWEQSIAVDVFYDQGKLLTFSQIKQLGPMGQKILDLAKNPEAEKDTRPEQVKSSDTLPVTTEKKVTGEVLPIMSPASREHVQAMLKDDKVKKIIAENAEVINDPKIVEGYETKFGDFAKQLGVKGGMEEFASWSYEMMYDLAKTKPDAAALMCFSFRNVYLKNRPAPAEKKEEAAPAATAKKPGLFKRSAAA